MFKQSFSNTNKIGLPLLRSNLHSKVLNRYKSNMKSLPKILPSSSQLESIEQRQVYKKKQHNNYLYNKSKQERISRKMLRRVENKNQNIKIDKCKSQNTQSQMDITEQFNRNIKNNLLLIKDQKRRRRLKTVQKQKSIFPYQKNFLYSQTRQKRKVGKYEQQSVFIKLNQIISRSKSKSEFVSINKSLQFSIINQQKNKKLINKESMGLKQKKYRKLKTDSCQPSVQSIQNDIKPHQQIKNVNNYFEWRKVAINLKRKGQLSYDQSSYQKQAERLEDLRIKNAFSLKKYFQEKSYLKKLKQYKIASFTKSPKISSSKFN